MPDPTCVDVTSTGGALVAAVWLSVHAIDAFKLANKSALARRYVDVVGTILGGKAARFYSGQ